MNTLFHVLTLSALMLSNLAINGAISISSKTESLAGILLVTPGASGSGSCTSWEDPCSLQSALEAAPGAGDEIWVAAGVYTPTVPSGRSATFQLKSGVALYGGFAGTETSREDRDWVANPTILSGDIDQNDVTESGVVTDTHQMIGANAYHVVTGSGITTAAVLDGFTITAGNANPATTPGQWGGGMYAVNSTITIRNVIFQGNYGVGGGGIFINGGPAGQPELDNVVFSQNHAGLNGGGMHTYNGSSPTLTDVIFAGNTADDRGGGMYNLNYSSSTLRQVTFSGNSAGSHGGGIYNENNSNPVLTEVTFKDNTAVYNGGGMYNWRSSPRLADVILSANTANASGGGLFNYDYSSPMLTGVTFFKNHAADSGGGMYNLSNSSPLLTDVIFAQNSASNFGGGVYNNGSNPTLANVTISGNHAAGSGGGMVNNSSYPSLINAIFWDNTGGLNPQIYNSASIPSIAYSDIQGAFPGGTWDSSLGTDAGGNLDVDPLFIDIAAGNLRLQLTSPAIDAGNNEAPGLSGVITDLDSSPRFVDVPSAPDTGYGAAPIVDMGAYEAQVGTTIIYVDQDSPGPTHDGTSWAQAFTGLQAALAAANRENEIWVAAGVYYPGVTGNISATFQLKSSVALFGGFAGTETTLAERDWAGNPSILSGDIDRNDLTDNNVVTDTDRIQGENAYHVITSRGVTTTAVLDGFTITAGNATGDSSTSELSGGMQTLAETGLTPPNVNLSADPTLTGGGMYNEAGSPTLANTIFSANSAIAGGGMYNTQGSPRLANVTFSANLAGFGGGMYNYYGSSPSLVDVTFSANSALTGGGMYNTNSSPILVEVRFSGNSVGISGGGMVNASSSNPTLTNIAFSKNSARYYGGGMLNWTSSPTLTNVTFFTNSALTGGGMANNSSNPTVTNATFSGNKAQGYGGGMFNIGSSPDLANSILWGNTALTNAQIYNDSSTPTIAYSDIQGAFSGGSWNNSLGTNAGGNLDANPLFVDAASGDLHLLEDSPAINAGDNTRLPADSNDLDGDGNTTEPIPCDLDGGARIQGSRVDMGAYEAERKNYLVLLPLTFRR